MVFSDPMFLLGFLPASFAIFHLLRTYVGGTAAIYALVAPLDAVLCLLERALLVAADRPDCHQLRGWRPPRGLPATAAL